ncbi:hypothetical protein LOK49_Contig462G00002 [Camellia lanceoleosa]|nr:hypothetical protein LOK49_Contig462G00002 [Camellia lanceoleosa]
MDWREESGGGVDVEMEEDDEDGVEDKEEKSVNSNGLAVGVEAPEFDKVALSRYLEQQPRVNTTNNTTATSTAPSPPLKFTDRHRLSPTELTTTWIGAEEEDY